MALNDPNTIQGPADFKRAASKIGFTFNWFYIDHDAHRVLQLGQQPGAARGRTEHELPGELAVRVEELGPEPVDGALHPPRTHPQAIDQAYLANWNNKQARGYRAADDNFGYGSIYRSQSLADRIKRGIRGASKMSITQLIDAMESAGTVDLRATKVLPFALRMLGRPRNPRMRHAVAVLRAWVRSGGHRLDRNHDGTYEHSEAVSILDRWWAKWIRAEFMPAMGAQLYRRAQSLEPLDDDPNLDGEHPARPTRGLVRLRAEGPAAAARPAGARPAVAGVLRRLEDARQGTRRKCQSRLRASLKRALKQDPGVFYKDKTCEDYEMPSSQWCYDAVRQRPVGAINQPLIHWINRPTFQQVVEGPKRRRASRRSTSRPRAGSRRLSRARGSPRAARGCGRRARAGATGPRRASRAGAGGRPATRRSRRRCPGRAAADSARQPRPRARGLPTTTAARSPGRVQRELARDARQRDRSRDVTGGSRTVNECDESATRRCPPRGQASERGAAGRRDR